MATGTVQHSPEAPGTMLPHKSDLHHRGKQLVESIRHSPRSNPFLITERQDEKQLCISSRTLRVSDFVLIKTLGTGKHSVRHRFPLRRSLLTLDFFSQYLGTFARVWLTRLKDQKDKSKVYALKILRKADGKRHSIRGCAT
jgi:hypothetical protein